jgi:multiple sugar transport system permease protein
MSSMPRAKRPRRLGRAGLYALLVVGCIPTILPLVWLVRSALMSDGQIFTSPPEWIPDPWMFRNFPDLFAAQPFATYFLNSAVIVVLNIVGTLLSCSLAAFSFARTKWRGRDLVFVLTLTTLMLPYAVTLIPTFLMWTGLGGIDTFLPLTVPSFFGAGASAGFYIFLLRQFFLGIPYELDEAAYVDGASPWRVYWQIVLPLAKPALSVVAVFAFVNTWNDFLGPLIYLNSQEKFTIAVGLAGFSGAYTGQWSLLMAGATLALLPVLLVFAFGQRYFIQGIAFTGGKS